MHARNLLTLALGCLLATAISAPTQAQNSNDANDLSNQLAALQIMNSTVGPMITQANTRNQQMLAFIKNKDLGADWAKYQPSAPTPQDLTFAEGYKVSLQRVQTEQPTTSTTASAADLQSNINATKSMVQNEWKSYHSAHTMSVQLTAFLHSKGMMADYETWSKTYSQERASNVQKQIDEANAKDSAAAQKIHAKFKAQQQYLMQHWDEEMHLKSLANSSGYIMERNKQSIVADSHEYPYLDSQTEGVNLNTENQSNSSGPGYYGGSWNGGYADPYYDVWGFPKDHDGHGEGADAYSRTVPPAYHPGMLAGAGGMEGSGRK